MEKELQELFVSYKNAVLAKKHGFDGECLGYYENQDKKLILSFTNNTLPQWATAAPTNEQLINWLKKKYEVNLWIAYRKVTCYYPIINRLAYHELKNKNNYKANQIGIKRVFKYINDNKLNK